MERTDFIYTGRAVYGREEEEAVLEVLRSEKLGLAGKGREFEKRFAKYMQTKNCVLTNSGSSASLLALDAIKHKRNLEGGEIITPACGFPTTVNPIFQLGFTPVFVDVDESYNLNPEIVEEALSDKTKGIFFAHTLGNPAKVKELKEIAIKRELFLIEDCCDAYGSTYKGKMCGSFGNASTVSFYPAHNITLGGEGGAVLTDDSRTSKILRSLRDWGKDCFCDAFEDNKCGKRFQHKIGGIEYDHKYIFSRMGYNLKPTEMQAAFGLAQLDRIEGFNKKRRENGEKLEETFNEFRDYFNQIKVNKGADPVLFGFPLMIKKESIDRNGLVSFLNEKKIATRYLFGGNLLNQPLYKGKEFRVSGELEMTDRIFKDLFWIGCHPAMGHEEIKYIGSSVKEYLNSK